MEQTKLNPNDPDFYDLNPELVKLAETNGNIRQSMELYLSGRVTWLQALETMVLLLAKEFRAQQKILIEVQMSQPSTTLQLLHATNDAQKLLEISNTSAGQ
jgi:hypothetical protein